MHVSNVEFDLAGMIRTREPREELEPVDCYIPDVDPSLIVKANAKHELDADRSSSAWWAFT